jgi:hypothetical protein
MPPLAQVCPFLEESTDPSNSEKTAMASCWCLVDCCVLLCVVVCCCVEMLMLLGYLVSFEFAARLPSARYAQHNCFLGPSVF